MTKLPAGIGTVASGSNLAPVPTDQVPEITVMNRDNRRYVDYCTHWLSEPSPYAFPLFEAHRRRGGAMLVPCRFDHNRRSVPHTSNDRCVYGLPTFADPVAKDQVAPETAIF